MGLTKAREKWRKNLATLRLLCMVCIQCRKAVAKLVPKDSWQRLTSTRALNYEYIQNSRYLKSEAADVGEGRR